jgi:hypothetical protein
MNFAGMIFVTLSKVVQIIDHVYNLKEMQKYKSVICGPPHWMELGSGFIFMISLYFSNQDFHPLFLKLIHAVNASKIE